MTYQETLEYLYKATPAFHQIGAKAYKPGLDTTLRLMAACGNPHLGLRCVHVAGTNGKGSTSHLLAAALQASGLRVGLYTSPHLVDFRERIRIFYPCHENSNIRTIRENQTLISEEYVVNWVEKYILSPLPGEGPGEVSFFEMATAMAFCYFRDMQVDIAVIEVGLGGRLDSTNVITPLLSVITNIGLDHTEFLGNTLAEIASEKAGIIKPGVPCVIGETHPETEPVFRAKTTELGSPICFADQQPPHPDIQCDLHGSYQEKNLQTFYTAYQQLCDILHLPLSRGIEGVLYTGLQGRWQILSKQPLTICDTGHNSHGIRTYVKSLLALMQEHRDAYLRIVFGMVNDKDVDVVLDLLPRDAFYYWTEASTHRAIPSDEMRRLGLAHGLIGESCGSVEQAMRKVQTESAPDDVIFIGGSNYVVGEVLSILKN